MNHSQSEGNQIRDFCHVSDIVDGIVATIKSDGQTAIF